MAKFRQPQGGKRRLFRRLQNHGATGRERRSDLPTCQNEREIPGNDARHYPDRLPQGNAMIWICLEGEVEASATEFGGPAGIVTVGLSRKPNFAGCHLDWFSRV